jgi:hypothetical protein
VHRQPSPDRMPQIPNRVDLRMTYFRTSSRLLLGTLLSVTGGWPGSTRPGCHGSGRSGRPPPSRRPPPPSPAISSINPPRTRASSEAAIPPAAQPMRWRPARARLWSHSRQRSWEAQPPLIHVLIWAAASVPAMAAVAWSHWDWGGGRTDWARAQLAIQESSLLERTLFGLPISTAPLWIRDKSYA